VWTAVGLFFLSLAVYWFVDLNVAFELINAVIMASSGGVAIAWFPLAVNSARKHLFEVQSDDALYIGIEILSLASFLLFLMLWIFRLTEQDYWRNHELAFAGRVGMAIGFLMFLSTAKAIEGSIPPKSYLKVGGYVAFGLMVAVGLITMGYK
jgi:hypothetical protein